MLFAKKYNYENIQVHKKGRGYPLLLIHGLNSSAETWNPVLSFFKRGFSVHMVKIKGFDGLAAPHKPSLRGVRDDIVRHIQSQELDKPIVVGHSLGGFLSLWAATECQNMGLLLILDSLPFMGAALNPYLTTFTAMPFANYMKSKVLQIETEEQWRTWQTKALGDMVSNDKNLNVALKWSMKADKRMAAEAIEGLFSIDLRSSMNKIGQPTLVLASWHGYAQHGFNRAQIHRIFERQYRGLMDKQIVMADDARHYLMLDDPKWTIQQMKNFIDAHMRRGVFHSRLNFAETFS